MNHFAQGVTRIRARLEASDFAGPTDALAEQIMGDLIRAGWREPLAPQTPIDINTGEKAPNPSERVQQLRALIPSKETTP